MSLVTKTIESQILSKKMNLLGYFILNASALEASSYLAIKVGNMFFLFEKIEQLKKS